MEHRRSRAKRSESHITVHPLAVELKLVAGSWVAMHTLPKLESRRKVLVRYAIRSADVLTDAVSEHGLEKGSLDTHSPEIPVKGSSQREKKKETFDIRGGSTRRSMVSTDPAVTAKDSTALPLVE